MRAFFELLAVSFNSGAGMGASPVFLYSSHIVCGVLARDATALGTMKFAARWGAPPCTTVNALGFVYEVEPLVIRTSKTPAGQDVTSRSAARTDEDTKCVTTGVRTTPSCPMKLTVVEGSKPA